MLHDLRNFQLCLQLQNDDSTWYVLKCTIFFHLATHNVCSCLHHSMVTLPWFNTLHCICMPDRKKLQRCYYTRATSTLLRQSKAMVGVQQHDYCFYRLTYGFHKIVRTIIVSSSDFVSNLQSTSFVK